MPDLPFSTSTEDASLSPEGASSRKLLTQQARSHYKLLMVLRRQLPTTGASAQIGVVATIARWLDAPPILTLIARTAPWYDEWEIKQALFSNPHTPRRVREEVGRIVSIFELMREMDRPGIEEQEKTEIREDIKSLFTPLSGTDKAIVRARAYRLSSTGKQSATQPRGAITLETPTPSSAADLVEYSLVQLATMTAELMADEPPDSSLPAVEAVDLLSFPPEERLTIARTTSDTILQTQALSSDQEELLEAVFANQELTEPLILAAAGESQHPVFFRVIARHDAWYQRPTVRAALLENPQLPPERQRGLQITEQIPMLFEALDYGGEDAEIAGRILGPLVDFLSSEDLTYALETVKVLYPHLAHLMFTTPSFTGELPPLKAVMGAAAAVETSEPASPEAEMLPEPIMRSGFQASLDQTTILRQLPVEARHAEAATTTDTAQMAILMMDAEDEVFEALLRNPVLSEDMVVGYARSISPERAEVIFRHSRWVTHPRVREALLDNPHTPHAVSLEILQSISDVHALLRVLKNPKITAIEVKQRAHHKLAEEYRALDSQARVALIKNTNGDILHELWDEAFHDEKTITTLLKEQFLEEGIVLRVVRSKAAPRAALAEIGANPAWVNNYQIRLELVMNPKTPREIIARLIGRLNPADRAKIKNNRNLPEYVRAMV